MKHKILLIALTIFLILSMCACTNAPAPNNATNEPDAVYWIDGFDLDLVGRSEITGIRFYLYREPVTDVVYIYEANHGGISPVLDPKTGLPMTYTQYKALCNQSQTTENTD